MRRSAAPESAVVVGAGIGGLTTALALARSGVHVTVLERAAELGAAMTGLPLSPNASRVLFAFGLEKPLEDIASRPDALEIRTWRGRRLARTPLGPAAAQRFGAPYLSVHHGDLQDALEEAALAANGIWIHLDSALAQIAQDEQSVTAVTEDGRSFRADFLVGADGVESTVREAIAGALRRRFTGCVSWRGVVSADAVRGADLHPVSSTFLGPGSHFSCEPVRGGELVSFSAVIEKTGTESESWQATGPKEELLWDFAGWHPIVQVLIDAADPDGCYKRALFDRVPLARWSQGRVVLLGDSGHPTLPFVPQGGCLAVEDAAVLADCVRGASDLPAALLRYESLRRPRVTAVQLASRSAWKLYHRSGARAWLRNATLPWAGRARAKRAEALFGYDATAAAR